MKTLYFDYAATTPVDPAVADVMARHLTLDGIFANPASRSHGLGWLAEEAVEHARQQVAALLGADPREIVWTSGATESDNLALKGVVEALGKPSCHIVTTAYEHKAVLDSCRHLERLGHRVTLVAPRSDGQVSPADVLAAMQHDTVLVSVMHVNNELGVINDVAAIGREVRARGVAFHVDAAQSIGKIAFDVRDIPADLVSVSAHKFYGPKGVGALYVRRREGLAVVAQMHGGGHERGMRSGTLPTHQIAGMGEAARLAMALREQEHARLTGLAAQLWEGIRDLPNIVINGAAARVPGILNVSFPHLDGETLLMNLPGLAVSSGSACNSASVEPSFVLKALGVPRAQAQSALRLSMGRFTTAEQVVEAIAIIRQAVLTLGRA